MSVTFCPTDGPKQEVREHCFLCEQTREFAEADGVPVPEWGCASCQGGWVTYSESECSLNVANRTAVVLLRMLGYADPDLRGSVPAEEVANMRRAIMRALNQDKVRAPFRTETETYGGEMRTVPQEDGTVALRRSGRHILCGYDDNRLTDRLERLDEVLQKAQELDLGVSWA